jgi:hypothetical protein
VSWDASVEDLGLGGARLVALPPVAAGDAVTVSFTAPTRWDALVLQGHIAWISAGEAPLSAGVAFGHTSADTLFALYELIATLFGYD